MAIDKHGRKPPPPPQVVPTTPAGAAAETTTPAPGGHTTPHARLFLVAVVLVAGFFALSLRSTSDVSHAALADARRQLEEQQAVIDELTQRAGGGGARKGQPASGRKGSNAVVADGEVVPIGTTKKRNKRRATPAPGAVQDLPPEGLVPSGENPQQQALEQPPDVQRDPLANDLGEDSSGGGTPVPAPEGSPESNKLPEDIKHPEERTFRHWIADLPALPEDAPPEAARVHAALTMYNDDREAPTNVPVYATACLGDADCPFVKDQLKSLDTGVGHIIVVLNRNEKKYVDYFRSMEKFFPGRFTMQLRDQGGCSESWNIMLRLGFSITPQPNFVMCTNGDLYAKPGYLARFAKYVNEHLKVHIAERFVHFSSFAVNQKGWAELGGFDEVIYPAYAEDVEYHLRAVSKGLMIGSFPHMQHGVSHKHEGMRSHHDPGFRAKYGRWDKNDYMFRKWGVDMRLYSDFQHAHPFRHPWEQKALSHRKSWMVDPAHRHCIRTGEGIRHVAHHGGCFLSDCNSCWYNASVLLPLLPPGTRLPDKITTRDRVRY